MCLAFSNAIAVHIQDAKEGKLVVPSDTNRKELEMYECLMASDTDEDMLTPTAPLTSNNFLNSITEYPSPDFTLPQRQVTSLIPLLTDSLN